MDMYMDTDMDLGVDIDVGRYQQGIHHMLLEKPHIHYLHKIGMAWMSCIETSLAAT